MGLLVNKRILLAAAFVSALLCSTVAVAQLVYLGKGQIPAIVGTVSPDAYTKPPVISISSPNYGTAYAVNSVSLSFSVSVGESKTARSRLFHEIYYIADWQQNKTQLLEKTYNEGDYVGSVSPTFVNNVSFTGIPEGNHNVTVYAEEWGAYTYSKDASFILMSGFSINGSSSVFFTVDTTPPNISILTPKNSTYETTDLPLNFTINEPASWTGYSLDGQDNVTISGNMTLTELSYGSHNLTVCANDTVGNVGASETVTFSIAEPEPVPFLTTWLLVGIASVATVSVGLLVYFKKRNKS